MQFGRTYEEFEAGAVYKHWPGKTVTEYDDHLFCLLTMNHHPLHLDAHYAGATASAPSTPGPAPSTYPRTAATASSVFRPLHPALHDPPTLKTPQPPSQSNPRPATRRQNC